MSESVEGDPTSRSRLRDHVRRDLAGLDLVSELLAERREAATAETALCAANDGLTGKGTSGGDGGI